MSKPTDSMVFEGLLDHYFEHVLAEDPVQATLCGLRHGEGRLGHATPDQEQRNERRRRKTLAALDRINPRALTPDQHLDRKAIRSLLLHGVEDHARCRHHLDPGALDSILNILLHELQRGEKDAARSSENLRQLLRAIPEHLAESASLLKHPDPLWLRLMAQTHDGAASLFDAVETFLRGNHSRPADGTNLAAARQAFTRYKDHAEGLKPAAEGSFALGAEGLQRRIRDEMGLDDTLGEIESIALAEVRRLQTLLQKACGKIQPGSDAAELLECARREWDPGPDLLGLYRSETKRIADAFRSAGVVEFPAGESLDVRPVPEFMRHLFPTAAYSAPGAFERQQRGIFWVNDLSLTRDTESDRLAERQQHFGIALTCAHEAYPGHHLQFTTANRHPRRWRRLFAHAVFYEGWTLWCEQMAADLRVDRSPWMKVQQLHDALWRAHRILVDLRLQTRRYTHRQATQHLQRHLGFTRNRAEADVNWYAGAPGVPMSYWLGRLENERLQRRLVDGCGWTVAQFNHWLLSHGTLPQRWLEAHQLENPRPIASPPRSTVGAPAKS